MKIKVLIWKIQYYGFVGNVYADLGLPWFSYWASFGFSRAHFRSKNMGFVFKWFFSMFDKSADIPKEVAATCRHLQPHLASREISASFCCHLQPRGVKRMQNILFAAFCCHQILPPSHVASEFWRQKFWRHITWRQILTPFSCGIRILTPREMASNSDAKNSDVWLMGTF